MRYEYSVYLYYNDSTRGKIPEDWAKWTIAPIYKRKEDAQGSKRYRGFSMQGSPVNIFTDMIQSRMKQYVERSLGEQQAGFRPGRSRKMITLHNETDT